MVQNHLLETNFVETRLVETYLVALLPLARAILAVDLQTLHQQAYLERPLIQANHLLKPEEDFMAHLAFLVISDLRE